MPALQEFARLFDRDGDRSHRDRKAQERREAVEAAGTAKGGDSALGGHARSGQYQDGPRRVQAGEEIVQETRHWDEASGVTAVLRRKETLADYRYFPDPDLVPVVHTAEQVEELRARLPELPRDARARLGEPLGNCGADVATGGTVQPTAWWINFGTYVAGAADKMVGFTAGTPYVYRVLVPVAIRGSAAVTPQLSHASSGSWARASNGWGGLTPASSMLRHCFMPNS